ncbi:MAG TPA: AraC family transcriptional regulator [Rhizomicrobium sp.]
MIALQGHNRIPSQQEIASAVVLLRSFAPDALASAVRGNFDAAAFALAGGQAKSAGLAPWQVKRAKALFESHLRDGIAVGRLAEACGLSRSHFSHAFKASTGASPHGWLIARRVEKAGEMLRAQALPLTEVALACGFSDQSHLTRLFRRATGVTPRAWRRLHRAAQ